MPEPGMAGGLLRLMLMPPLPLVVRVQYPRVLGWPGGKRCALPGDHRMRTAELHRAAGLRARPRGCR